MIIITTMVIIGLKKEQVAEAHLKLTVKDHNYFWWNELIGIYQVHGSSIFLLYVYMILIVRIKLCDLLFIFYRTYRSLVLSCFLFYFILFTFTRFLKNFFLLLFDQYFLFLYLLFLFIFYFLSVILLFFCNFSHPQLTSFITFNSYSD